MLMTLEALLTLITEGWPARFERGCVCHVHRNYLPLPDGRYVHLRVLIQEVDPPTLDVLGAILDGAPEPES